jgi:hypothetical protein
MNKLKFILTVVCSVCFSTYTTGKKNLLTFPNFIDLVEKYRNDNEDDDCLFFAHPCDLAFLEIDLKIKALKEMAIAEKINPEMFEKILNNKETSKSMEEFKNKLFSILKQVTKETTNESALKVILAEEK